MSLVIRLRKLDALARSDANMAGLGKVNKILEELGFHLREKRHEGGKYVYNYKFTAFASPYHLINLLTNEFNKITRVSSRTERKNGETYVRYSVDDNITLDLTLRIQERPENLSKILEINVIV